MSNNVMPFRPVILRQIPQRHPDFYEQILRLRSDVKLCDNIGQALRNLHEEAVDLLLVDLSCEGDLEQIGSIATARQHHPIPVIGVVNSRDERIIDQAIALGIDDVFPLPMVEADIENRFRALSRLVRMETEFAMRAGLLRCFGDDAAPTLDPLPATQILFFGPSGADQVQIMSALDGAISASYAQTVDSAIERWRRGHLDLIVATASHSLSAVFDLCAALAEHLSLDKPPVIFVAQEIAVADRTACQSHGLSDLVLLSLQPQLLRARLRCWMHQQHIYRRLKASIVSGSVTDSLTGLCSHGFLHSYLEETIGQSFLRGTPSAVAGFTVSGIGDVNSMFGYAVGDRLLRLFGQTVGQHCRTEDLPARCSGHRFCVVMNRCNGKQASQAQQRMEASLRQQIGLLAQDQAHHMNFQTAVTEIRSSDNAASILHRVFKEAENLCYKEAS